MTSNILTDHRGPVLWITLNRPEAKNAFTLEMGTELLKAVRQGMKEKGTAVIAITGAGETFSAGGDIKLMSRTQKPKGFFLKISRLVNTVVLEMQNGGKPVIAAIPGYVGGIAFGMVLGADLRIASTEAKFNAATIRLGLVANGGATYFLPRLVGLARASEILLLGDILSAEEALKTGLINRVVSLTELESTVQEMAERLASGPRRALGRLKKIIRQGLHSSLSAQLERERQAIAWSATTPDFREGIIAFLEKRRPNFREDTRQAPRSISSPLRGRSSVSCR
ncbi:MAG: enoyl-CoA hydratase/isomerase family protein [Deltaproteobacteria bacterium]|nr:enoyl-CoA hydratase/isomerase family protein [Deltaproteobacteria bacterium]MBI4373663.1 enoyl-CoA hydratase/isomerase family protein [Deltaproteobacteria bacterium]